MQKKHGALTQLTGKSSVSFISCLFPMNSQILWVFKESFFPLFLAAQNADWISIRNGGSTGAKGTQLWRLRGCWSLWKFDFPISINFLLWVTWGQKLRVQWRRYWILNFILSQSKEKDNQIYSLNIYSGIGCGGWCLKPEIVWLRNGDAWLEKEGAW